MVVTRHGNAATLRNPEVALVCSCVDSEKLTYLYLANYECNYILFTLKIDCILFPQRATHLTHTLSSEEKVIAASMLAFMLATFI